MTERPAGPIDSWTTAIYVGTEAQHPKGAGVVIDVRRVLTCAHVVKGARPEDVSVAFPKAGLPAGTRHRVVNIEVGGPADIVDVAVLTLEQPVPAEVAPARLRCPTATDLLDDQWWAFGFPGGDVFGDEAFGVVGAGLAYGWVRLDTTSRYVVEPGFSGAGMWSTGYEAVVGLVGQARPTGDHKGDARALTLRQVDLELPEHKLGDLARWSATAAGETALAAWGWALPQDPEAGRHWRPRARGVSVDSERGHRFKGRRQALSEITAWLDRPASDRRVLVVTGSPGVGKSAVLGRIVTTADTEIRSALPVDDDGVKATLGSVACAVHAKGKTALEIAAEIARAASVVIPQRVDDLLPALRIVLEDRRLRFNLVLDALDEAASPGEARAVVSGIVLPLAQTCADIGAQVVVGTRRRDDEGDLLRAFTDATTIIDLDQPSYFAERDLVDYVLATLQMVGDERHDNPYARDETANSVAERIASLARRNFLVAGLVARTHGMHDQKPVAVAELNFTPTVDAALEGYVQRLPQVGTVGAMQALTILAYAEAPGLPVSLWRMGLEAFGTTVTDDKLISFARSSAANFLVETSGGPSTPTFRLFHQALNDALLRARDDRASRAEDQRRLTRRWAAYGRSTGWTSAARYLLRTLPAHADQADMVDDLLVDRDYVVRADLHRLVPVSSHAVSEVSARRARLLQLTPHAATAEPGVRAAMFTVTEALEDLGDDFRDMPGLPYRALWADAVPSIERAVLASHTGFVLAVCRADIGDRTMLATAGYDCTIRLWDTAAGQTELLLDGHEGPIRGICAAQVDGDLRLISASNDGTVRIWNITTGKSDRILRGHDGIVRAVCAVNTGQHDLVVSAGDDGTVRVWNVTTDQYESVLRGHDGPVTGLCTIAVGGNSFVASAGDDGTVRIWSLGFGADKMVRTGQGRLRALCAVNLSGRALLATAGTDQDVRLWDAVTLQPAGIFSNETPGILGGLCQIRIGSIPHLAAAGDDHVIRLWSLIDHSPPRHLKGHTGAVNAVAAISTGGVEILASGSGDRTVRLWDTEVTEASSSRESSSTELRGINAVCAVGPSHKGLFAVGHANGDLELRDRRTGTPTTRIRFTSGISTLFPVEIDGRNLIAVGLADRKLVFFDTETGDERDSGAQCPLTMRGEISACAVLVGGRLLVATARWSRVHLWDPVARHETILTAQGANLLAVICPAGPAEKPLLAVGGSGDGYVWLWNPATGAMVHQLDGERPTSALCSLHAGGRDLLVSGALDGSIRVWDTAKGDCVATLVGHTSGVRALCSIKHKGKPAIASVGYDRILRLWDPLTGSQQAVIPIHHPAYACIQVGDSLILALSAGLLGLQTDLQT
ncbi:trypsin-like peptidase domain-containing protein [Actinoplanes sp. L3-i22]|uniref:trypsin-like peptidase domain-containing protein n=1 Tax=Actinoplanes sp. L3-i22 TaxID=2836373 RepID=UPI001C767E06|nr:trypsin-like peptidase domain-containing protein [Actinoplanes sp. L3-i22]BCY13124.1 hypothetical protein L3i22_082120 [Actinoplanes sp. L3-i22]